ncbi:hypothetical protein D3C72_1893830 [compost metagenome]
MEVQVQGARFAEGDIRQQVDSAVLRELQAGLPVAGHRGQLPVFPAGDFTQQLAEDAGDLSVLTQQDLRLVGVDAHPHLARLRPARRGAEHAQCQ